MLTFFSDLFGTYKRARDTFQRCLALCLSTRQDQLRSPVEGLTSRNVLRECNRVPTRSLPHSLCAYYNLVCENRTEWERTKLPRMFSMMCYWILRRKSLSVQFKTASWSRSRKGEIKQVKRIKLAQDERSTLRPSIRHIMEDARNERSCTLRGFEERESDHQPDTTILPSNDSTETSTARIGLSCRSLFTNSEKSPNETCPTIGILYTQNVQGLTGKDKIL